MRIGLKSTGRQEEFAMSERGARLLWRAVLAVGLTFFALVNAEAMEPPSGEEIGNAIQRQLRREVPETLHSDLGGHHSGEYSLVIGQEGDLPHEFRGRFVIKVAPAILIPVVADVPTQLTRLFKEIPTPNGASFLPPQTTIQMDGRPGRCLTVRYEATDVYNGQVAGALQTLFPAQWPYEATCFVRVQAYKEEGEWGAGDGKFIRVFSPDK